MKLIAIITAAHFVAGRVLKNPSQPSLANNTANIREISENKTDEAYGVPKVLQLDRHVYADDEQWAAYLAKGSHLRCLMTATDVGAGFLMKDTRMPPSAASEWRGDLVQELRTWFWQFDSDDKGSDCDFTEVGLAKAFRGQRLNPKPVWDNNGAPGGGNNRCYTLTHYLPDHEFNYMDQKYYVDGLEYMATSAFYAFAMNRRDGAIIAQNIDSPSFAVQSRDAWGRRARPGELPKLRFLSDIYWGFWIRENPDVKNLRVYGAYHVINYATTLIVGRAMRNMGLWEYSQWPGVSFTGESEIGQALIGTPIGATIAHLLIARKAELGIKRISRVTIVTNEPEQGKTHQWNPLDDLQIFFGIENVPRGMITDPGPEDTQIAKRTDTELKNITSDSKVVYAKDGRMLREHILQFIGQAPGGGERYT